MKKTLALVVLLSLFLSPTATFASYEDVSEDCPYQESIAYLELTGALDSAENFRPDALVTKAEFFKILFKVFGAETETPAESSFKDVPKNEWFSPYAELALDSGLVSEGVFEPGRNLRRGEVLGTLLEAYGYSPAIIAASQRSQLFADIGPQHPYYSLISRAADMGILETDSTSRYFPYEKLSRGEVADMIYSLEEWVTVSLAEEEVEESDDFYKSDIFADIWRRILSDLYLPSGEEIDEEALFQVAVKAVLESLSDPYTKYFDAKDASEFMDSLGGSFEGIGAIMVQDEGTLEIFISGFIDESPAAKSGLKAGDLLTAVDGVSVSELAFEDVVERIKGPAGTTVEITILREDETLTYKITRAAIGLDLVKGSIFNDDSWLIEIDSFGSDIWEDTMTTLATLEAEVAKPEAIILDLRGNPGGYVNMANFIAGLFLPQFTTLVYLDYGSHYESISNADIGPYQDYPLYILVDEYTASASEIAALTLSEAGKDVTVIGKQTFGKGTAQEVITYWDGSILKMTVAEWLSTGGTSVRGVGLTPDILITGVSETKDLWLEEVNDLLD